jgi:hypothetical protein
MLASESSWEGTMLYFIWQAIPPFFREGPYKTKKNSKTESIVALSFFSKPNVMYWQMEPIVGYSPGKWQLLWAEKGKIVSFGTFIRSHTKWVKSSRPLLCLKNHVMLERIQECSERLWPCPKEFSRSCLVIYIFFCNPSHKTETGRAKRWGTTNNKPLGPIIIMGPIEKNTEWEEVRSYLLTLFSVGAQQCCAFFS